MEYILKERITLNHLTQPSYVERVDECMECLHFPLKQSLQEREAPPSAC